MSGAVSDTLASMGRRKKFDERCVASFVKGTFARIEAVLPPTDDRTDFIRDAVEERLRWLEDNRAPERNE